MNRNRVVDVAAQKRTAEVVELPVVRLCSTCEHGALSSKGVFCLVFSEPIWDEREASDCDAYEAS